jgi:SsrA-binding protein
MTTKKETPYKLIAENRKGRYNYEILETFEAGIVLTGTEVKSLRASRVSIAESHAAAEGSNFVLFNVDIPEYLQANRFNHERKRPRRLLLKRKEINRLTVAVQKEGLTIIALKMYFNIRGVVKFELALAKGKKLHDKRETEKTRDWNRDKARLMREKG